MEIILIIIALFFLISCFANSSNPDIIGKKGEGKVSKILSYLPKDKYIVINDILIEYEHGTIQIDHVVVSMYGIFVIETKNYKGWIFGCEKSNMWVKNVFGRKYYFYNPIKQNRSHILALMYKLTLSDKKFNSVIVFSSRAALKVHTETPVIYFQELNQLIKKYTEQKFSFEQMNEIVKKINTLNINTSKMRKKHNEDVKERIRYKNEIVMFGICPECGGKLVPRYSRYGEFTGCSNFPDCKYIRH